MAAFDHFQVLFRICLKSNINDWSIVLPGYYTPTAKLIKLILGFKRAEGKHRRPLSHETKLNLVLFGSTIKPYSPIPRTDPTQYMKLLISHLLLLSSLLLSYCKNVDSRVDNSHHSIALEPTTHHSLNSQRDKYTNSLALDIDKSNSIFNTYLRDIPIIYSHLEDAENEILLLSVSDYNIHKLGYKVWQFPRHLYNDMSEMEKEIVVRENIIEFINDYVVNLQDTENNMNMEDLIDWLETKGNHKQTITLNNENGKSLVFEKDGLDKIRLDNGYQTLLFKLIFNVYENGVVLLVDGCFDKRSWN